jgi:hypothetical protein
MKAREVVSLGRELLGGNGILADFLVAKVRANIYRSSPNMKNRKSNDCS